MAAELPSNKLYLALFALETGRYHWSFYIPSTHGLDEGDVFHVTNFAGAEDWRQEFGLVKAIVGSLKLVLMVEVANFEDGLSRRSFNRHAFRKSIEKVGVGNGFSYPDPSVPPAEQFTCTCWAMECLRQLHRDQVIDCPDPEAFHTEAVAWARANSAARYKPGEFKVMTSTKSRRKRYGATSRRNSTRF